MNYERPSLIVVGGYPGSGKSSVARKLATDFRFPRLSSDAINDAIRSSQAVQSCDMNTVSIAYDVAFALCSQFLKSSISTILDLNMGWAFQWQRLDEIRANHPLAKCYIFLLHCPRDVCHARIQQRHATDSTTDAVEVFQTGERFLKLWNFLDQLDRPDILSINAARSFEAVYHDVKQRIEDA